MSSPAMSPMRRPSGSHVVYTELRRRVLDGELAPGERVYETELAASLGVSRTPYREAVRLLMAEGLLEQQATGGVVVRGVSARDIEQLYAVRACLEGLMAADAARLADEPALTRLRDLVERNERLVDLPAEASEAGHSFHLAIAEVAGNDWTARLHEQVDVQMARYRQYTNETPERRRAALAEHRGILAAIEAHDVGLARERAEVHVLTARDVALAAISGHLPT